MSSENRDGFLTVTDGLSLHYRDYPGNGERPPILCLHGLTRNARDFAEFAETILAAIPSDCARFSGTW